MGSAGQGNAPKATGWGWSEMKTGHEEEALVVLLQITKAYYRASNEC